VRVQSWVLNLHNYLKLWNHMLEMKEQHGMDRREMTHTSTRFIVEKWLCEV
jgi:hypothetical protein